MGELPVVDKKGPARINGTNLFKVRGVVVVGIVDCGIVGASKVSKLLTVFRAVRRVNE